MAHSTAEICDQCGDAARVVDGINLRFGKNDAFMGPAAPIVLHGPDQPLADILKTPGEGRVAVVSVDHTGANAVFGEGMARNAEANGWAGVVIDGAVRDVATFTDRNIGIAARSTHPAIVREGQLGGAADTVTVGGVKISNSDTIVVDRDGVVIVATSVLAG